VAVPTWRWPWPGKPLHAYNHVPTQVRSETIDRDKPYASAAEVDSARVVPFESSRGAKGRCRRHTGTLDELLYFALNLELI
jgi:hypothetical protein